MKFIPSWFWPITSALLVIVVVADLVTLYKVGRSWLPPSLFEWVDKVNPDNSAADALQMAIAQGGFEERAWITLAVVIVAAAIWLVVTRRFRRNAKRVEDVNGEIGRLYGMPEIDAPWRG